MSHRYNTRSSTKRVNHLIIFKNTPKVSVESDRNNKITHSLRLIFLHRPQKIYNHSVNNYKPHPLQNHKEKLGYRDQFNMDELMDQLNVQRT